MPDPGALAALHAACFTTPRPWSASEIAALLASPHVFVIRESAGFLIGRALAGEAELLTLAVDPAQRRQGMGARLMDGFLAQGRARGAETAFLEVAASNAAALSLYQQAGFGVAGRRKRYYAAPDGTFDDALILTRTL
ncbi:MAG: ribosomal protein S18-alanine N-acetyltransferase [Rhodobacteraceae bacterium]|nr:ribosomal protein S18-alanine N-acetyltransferase [Paracoccaceae bacterium]